MNAGAKSWVQLFLLLLVLSSLSVINADIQSIPSDMAPTAELEWERVRYNTAITSAKMIGEATITNGFFEAQDMPYKSLSFPVTGFDDPGCGSLTKCSAWDWANHSHPITSNSFHLKDDGDSASALPPFVKNMTYIPNFICYEGNWLQWAGATTSQFQDPVPPNHFVVQVVFILRGTFVCDMPSTQFNIILQSDPISTQPISAYGETYPQDCSCQVCASNFTYVTPLYTGVGIPTYLYGDQNRVYIIPLNGSMCLNSIEMRLYYEPKKPLVASIEPSAGPREGGTTVSIIIDNYDPQSTYVCHMPVADIVASPSPNDDNTVLCVMPDPCAITESKFQLEIYSSSFPQLPIGTKLFTAYNQPSIAKVTPSRALPGENITLSGNYLSIHTDLVWSCRIGGQLSTVAVSTGSTLICTVPASGMPLNDQAAVEVSLNGQNWSNAVKLFIVSPNTAKKWYEMPTLLYIILGSMGGLLLIILVTVVSYRMCRKPKSAFDESEDPLLRSSYGPRAPHSLSNSEFSTIPTEFEKIDVSKITLGKRIGKGSFGEVYQGTYLGTDVAVKKILTNKISPEFMQEFAREAALMRDLRHPNVVQFLGAAMEEPDICIVTEYMSKGSLYHLLHDPKVSISWETVRKVALDAARGMAYLHLRTPAIIHRDLKSHNLLVDDNWKVKVCDFGLSKIAVDMQATMTACGTPCWTAPEILRNSRYTTKADVFSYGIVLWELVTREEPFAGMPAFQVIFAVGTKGVRLPLPSVCPPELIKLIVSCWQEDPALRPPFSDIIIYLERLSFATRQ
jgi:tRNA A-37 threonylcarbamoyl transferase component Bud32